MDDAEWEALLQKGRDDRAKAAKIAHDVLATPSKSVRFSSPRYGLKYLVGPDLTGPTGWRVTTFSKDGQPVGHYEVASLEAGILDMVRSGNPMAKTGEARP